MHRGRCPCTGRGVCPPRREALCSLRALWSKSCERTGWRRSRPREEIAGAGVVKLARGGGAEGPAARLQHCLSKLVARTTVLAVKSAKVLRMRHDLREEAIAPVLASLLLWHEETELSPAPDPIGGAGGGAHCSSSELTVRGGVALGDAPRRPVACARAARPRGAHAAAAGAAGADT